MRSLVAKTCQLATSILQLPMTTAAAFMRRVAKRARVKQMVRGTIVDNDSDDDGSRR